MRVSFSALVTSLAKALLVLGFSFVLAEALLRAFGPNVLQGYYQYDPDLGFRVSPHYVMPDGTRTNQFGFNAPDYSLAKPPDVFRMVVVGDSFNWAGGRDGNYTALLQRKLDALYRGHKVDVINEGYPMTHTAEQLAMLEKFGLQYDPDLVVLGLFAGNDFVDADPNRKRIVVNDTYVDIDRRHERPLPERSSALRSQLFTLLQQKYKIWKERRAAKRDSASAQQPTEESFSEATFLALEKARMDFFSLRAARERKYQANIDYILRSIAELAALLKAHQTRFVVAIYPDEFQVNQDLARAIFTRFKLNPDDYDLAFAQKLLQAFLDDKGIPCIDLLERFRAEGQRQPLYKLRNTHWNEAGNELAAQVLFDTLTERGELSLSSPRPASRPSA